MKIINKKYLFPYLLVFFEMATYLSSDMYLPALPTVMRDFSLSHQEAQTTLTAWFLGTISVQLLLGPIADRFGRRPVLCLGGIIFTCSTLACALANSIEMLLAARFIQGMGICFMAVPGYASIHESFDQKEAIRLIALMGSVSVLAPAFGPLLGSVVLLAFSWRWIFGFLVIWSALAVGLLIKWMPETLPMEKRHPLNFALIMQSYKRIIFNLRFMGTVTLFGLAFCGFITWIVAGPFLVIDQFKESAVLFSIYQGLIFLAYMASNSLVKNAIKHLSLKNLVRVSLFACLLICALAVVFSIQFPSTLLVIIITYILYSFASGFAFAPLNRLAIEASDEPMGARVAIDSMMVSGYAVLASILVTLFYTGSLLSIAWIMLAVVGIACVLASFSQAWNHAE